MSTALDDIRRILETAVCTEGADKGVVLLSDHGTTHLEAIGPPNASRQVSVYDHEYFSPLGDALIAAWEKTLGAASEPPAGIDDALKKAATIVRSEDVRAIESQLDFMQELVADLRKQRGAALERTRRFKRMAKLMAQQIVPWPSEDSFTRAGGDVPCNQCGLPYFDHPEKDGLILDCNGRLWKL